MKGVTFLGKWSFVSHRCCVLQSSERNAKNRNFWRKSAVFDKKTTDFDKKLWFQQKTMDFNENHRFRWKLQILMKTADFNENCSFQADLSSETAKITFPTQPWTGRHQTLKYIDFLVKWKINCLRRPFYLIFSMGTHWLLSRPFDPILTLCTQLTHFKTISPNFIIVYPNDSFKTIWPNFIIVYSINFIQDHIT